MASVGLCRQCKRKSYLNIFQQLCEPCLAQNTQVSCKRKRYESEISRKSGISALSVGTQLTDIQDESDLEFDGPSSDVDSDQDVTRRKSIDFDLHSAGSLSAQKFMNPTENLARSSSRSILYAKPASSTQNKKFARAQTNRRRQPRIHRNYSESDTSSFNQQPHYFQQISGDGRNDTIVALDEQRSGQPTVILARPVNIFKSDPNLHKSGSRNFGNIHESLKDDDSGYIRNRFLGPPNQQRVQQEMRNENNIEGDDRTTCDNFTQKPKRLICILVVTVVTAWVPVAVLSWLLLSSVHKEDQAVTDAPPKVSALQKNITEELVKKEVDRILARSSAPLRLEGTGWVKVQWGYSLKWIVSDNFVENPISLLREENVYVRVSEPGYYVVSCRIHYAGKQHSKQPFTVRHSLYKKLKNNQSQDQKLDSVSQHCLYTNDSRVEHTSTLQSLVHLEAGAQIYIRLPSVEFINQTDCSKNVMGIFLLPWPRKQTPFDQH